VKNIKKSVRCKVYTPVSDKVWLKVYKRVRHVVNEDVWDHVHSNTNNMTRNNNIFQNVKLFAEREL
jgi:hypothetical protein